MRTVQEVFEDHLKCRLQGDAIGDGWRNYYKEVVVLSTKGVFEGREGLLRSARILDQDLKDGVFEFNTIRIKGDYALLEWTGISKDTIINDGADSFVIKDGKIIFQSIHYTVTKRRRNMDDDYKLQNYQDDLDTETPDPFINEMQLSPAEELGVNEKEYKEELDALALDDVEYDHEDMRETIEDRDEDDNNGASTS
jgi:hypothetical protein